MCRQGKHVRESCRNNTFFSPHTVDVSNGSTEEAIGRVFSGFQKHLYT